MTTTGSRRSSRYLGRFTAAQLDRAGTPNGPQTQSLRAVWASDDQPTAPGGDDAVDVCGPPTVAASEFVARAGSLTTRSPATSGSPATPPTYVHCEEVN